ncbi:MAG: OB-fold domain-containing protein [Pseudomonadota bacterium]
MSYEKPLPLIDVWSRPFWDACKEKRLIAQQCEESGEIWLPPSPVSPVTRTDAWRWIDLSGNGRVWSFVVMHQRYFEGFADDLPYNIVQILLDEGPMLISNLVGIENDRIEVDMPVEVVFEEATEAITLPKFQPVP